MSRMLLTPPPAPRHARDAAAAEIALALHRPWQADALARRALVARPGDTRALSVLARLGAVADREERSRRAPSPSVVSRRVIAAYRMALGWAINDEEARIAIEGLLREGHARARPSRRHRGEPLPAGARIVVHHRHPAIAIVVRGGRAIGVRVHGRTVTPGSRHGGAT